ncbi:MAG: fibronectin type III domain-containing protein, partial [Treponema sp.]|nr:fibronectin type III domain-containing protein [Treponema sp.]
MKVSRKGKGPCVPGIALFVFILEACVNQFLPEPRIIRTAVDSGDTQKNDWGAPQNVTITQGKKRAISLSWEPVEGAVRYNIYKSESPL